MPGTAHRTVPESVGVSQSPRVWGKVRPWSIWCLQCKGLAEAGSQWGSPGPFRKEIVAQLAPGHDNKHRKNKIIKQEKEGKNDRGLRQCWEPGLRQWRSLPEVIVRNWKTLSSHLPGAAEQFSSISKQFEICWLYEKGTTMLDLKVSEIERALCCPQIKVLGSREQIEVYWFSIDETLTTAWSSEITPLSSENIVSHPRLTVKVDK